MATKEDIGMSEIAVAEKKADDAFIKAAETELTEAVFMVRNWCKAFVRFLKNS